MKNQNNRKAKDKTEMINIGKNNPILRELESTDLGLLGFKYLLRQALKSKGGK